MTTTIEYANDLLRAAVAARREAQDAGKPLEEWYDVSQAATEPRCFDASTEETQPMPEETLAEVSEHADQPLIEHMLHQYHLHRAGVQDELVDAAERLARDGIAHEQRPGSLPFLKLIEEVRQLHLSKSQDYGSESDPLANIRQGAEFVGIEPWRGCLVRVADKVQRLKTFCKTGRLVHEGVRDTLLDLSAYSLLAIVLFDEGKNA
jgi:hypothetical protein